MKTCIKCKQIKSIEEFAAHKLSKDLKQASCRECKKEYDIAWRANNQDKRRANHLKRMFGITLEKYNEMFQEQKGKCLICKKHQIELEIRLAVDHDHITGKIRGLLCDKCNLSIGLLEDNITYLQNAIIYLTDTRRINGI